MGPWYPALSDMQHLTCPKGKPSCHPPVSEDNHRRWSCKRPSCPGTLLTTETDMGTCLLVCIPFEVFNARKCWFPSRWTSKMWSMPGRGRPSSCADWYLISLSSCVYTRKPFENMVSTESSTQLRIATTTSPFYKWGWHLNPCQALQHLTWFLLNQAHNYALLPQLALFTNGVGILIPVRHCNIFVIRVIIIVT